MNKEAPLNTLILFESDRLKDDLFEVTDSLRLDHLKDILKVSLGDSLKVGLLNHSFGKAQVTNLSPMRLQVQFDENIVRPSSPLLELWIGLSRPPTLKKVLEHATSMGVGAFKFYRGTLSEKSYANSKIFEAENLNELLVAGLSQSSRSLNLPKVEVETSGVKSLEAHDQSFVLSLRENRTLHDYELDFSRPMRFVLGPERGLTVSEEEALLAKGFKPVKIHESILRVEIASFALLGALQTLKYLKHQE